jgi:hypothetical protein
MAADPRGVQRLAFALLNGTAEAIESSRTYDQMRDTAGRAIAYRFSSRVDVRVLWIDEATPTREQLDTERRALMARLVELDALTARNHDETEIELDQMRGAPTGPQRAGSGA